MVSPLYIRAKACPLCPVNILYILYILIHMYIPTESLLFSAACPFAWLARHLYAVQPTLSYFVVSLPLFTRGAAGRFSPAIVGRGIRPIGAGPHCGRRTSPRRRLFVTATANSLLRRLISVTYITLLHHILLYIFVIALLLVSNVFSSLFNTVFGMDCIQPCSHYCSVCIYLLFLRVPPGSSGLCLLFEA